MANKQDADEINIDKEISESLIDKMDKDQLSSGDKKIITMVLRNYIFLADLVRQTGVKLKSIRSFLFGPKTKHAKKKLQAIMNQKKPS